MTEAKDGGAPPGDPPGPPGSVVDPGERREQPVDEGWDSTTGEDPPGGPGESKDAQESTRSLDSDELAQLVASGKPKISIGLRTGAAAAKEPRAEKKDPPPTTDDLGAAFDDLVAPAPGAPVAKPPMPPAPLGPMDEPVRYTPSPDPVPFLFGDDPVPAPQPPAPPAPRVDSMTAPIDVSPPAHPPPPPDATPPPPPGKASFLRGPSGEVKPAAAIIVAVATAVVIIGLALFVKKVLLRPKTADGGPAPSSAALEADARSALSRFGEGLKACVPTIGWLPGTSPAVPAAMDVGGVYSVDPKEWKTPVWVCTRFSVPSPQRFMLQWQQLKLNSEGMAVAWIDVDGDGKPDKALAIRATLRKKGDVEVGDVETLPTLPPILKQR